MKIMEIQEAGSDGAWVLCDSALVQPEGYGKFKASQKPARFTEPLQSPSAGSGGPTSIPTEYAVPASKQSCSSR